MDNLNRLGSMIENFIYETYKIPLNDVFDYEDFTQLLHNTMNNVESSNRSLPIMDKNKMVIVRIRDYIFEKTKKSPQPPKPTSSFKPEKEPETEAQIIPTPEMDREEDDKFFKKLQDLEQRRKLNLPQQPLAVPPVTQQVPLAPMTVQIPQVANTPVAPPPVIVAVPPPPRHGIHYIISSWDRRLIEHPERANFVWNNTLPAMIDPLGTRIAGVFLPVSVCNYTPYLTLHIEGASGSHISCVLSPEYYPVGRTRGWLQWSPINESLSYIKNVSSPWTIQLRSADGTILPLGRDNTDVASVNIDITNKSARLILSPTPQEGEFLVGDQIWIYTKTERKKTEVLSVSADMIEVKYQIPVKTTSLGYMVHEWVQARVLNYSRQWSIVFDLTSSEHRKNNG